MIKDLVENKGGDDMPKFYRYIADKKGNGEFEEIQGEVVDCVPWLETFIYMEEDRDSLRRHGPFEVYNVVEARSGWCVGRAFDRESAIKDAKAELKLHGKEASLAVFKKTIAETGLSPLYR